MTQHAQSVLYCRVEANRQEVVGAGLNPGILEGTWEELAAHAKEFRGRKPIVLPTEPEVTGTAANETGLQEAARRLFTEADNIEREPGRPMLPCR
jgi:hypothetical protein